MPLFSYKAMGADGAVVRGELEARDEAETIDRLIAKGLTPVHATPADRAGMSLFAGGRSGALRLRDLTLFTRQLAVLLSSGVVLERALMILSGPGNPPRTAALAGRLLERLRGGAALSQACAEEGFAFPEYYISLLRAGETAGAVTGVLQSLAEQLDRAMFIRSRIRSALAYPIFLTVMIGLSLLVIFTVVLPQFEDLFDTSRGALPWPTALMLGLRSVLADWWWALLLAVGGGVFAAMRLVQVPAIRQGLDRRLITSRLLLGLVQKAEGARLARLVGTLAGRGVSLPRALELSADSLGNRALAEEVRAAAQKVKRGGALAPALGASGLLPALVPQMISVGEETGNLSEMALEAAAVLERDVQHTIERLLALLTPVMTAVMGGIVALVVGSMILGLMSIHDFAM
ncbi:MAG: type II secretion system F family protein [bacterium]